MKSQSNRGGSRPATRPNDGRKGNGAKGNQGQGRMVRWVELSKEDAKTVRILLSVRGKKATEQEIAQYLGGLIREQWAAFDADVQAKAEELAEVEMNDAIIL